MLLLQSSGGRRQAPSGWLKLSNETQGRQVNPKGLSDKLGRSEGLRQLIHSLMFRNLITSSCVPGFNIILTALVHLCLIMTSLPQRQHSSQQRPSSPEASSSRQDRRSSIPQSTTSEDSQTVLLNHPPSSESSPKPEPQRKQQSRPKIQTAESNEEPRKCWICFADETEDTPTSSEWRSPCPCALTAHESCLLDWVADLENPNNRKSSGPPKIECPQCKAKITIARPRSFVVEGVRAVQRATARFVLPFTFVTLYVLFGTCSSYSG